MRDKLKKLSEVIDELEKLTIKIINLVGWLYILKELLF